MGPTHGFELLREQDVPERASRARLYRHQRTGAELLSIENDDPNKVFGIAFGTLPRDSTGVAHILEHIVLAGSRKYPLKDPLAELIKGSLRTFLNAMTYPDRTVYPVASQNLADFYNLVDVYLDTVFHPLLRRRTFAQEAWHYELADAGTLGYKGVVFNEMKGTHSAPDQMLTYWHAPQTLFPDTPYGVDVGGDPRAIPELTYEQLAGFYRTFYHPSNARIFFWGDDPPDERLRLLDAALRDFEPAPVDSTPPLQPPFDAPRRAEFSYDPGGDAGPALGVVAWALDEPDGAATALALTVLNHILLGMPAAPLRKALLAAGLGEELVGGGLIPELRQPPFVVGLRGVPAGRAQEIEPLVLGTLETLARDGLDPNTVAASLNTVEFQLRELNSGGEPRGLAVLMDLLCAWSYGRDPLAALAFEGPLAQVKAQAAGERFFERMIERALLHNPHRATVLLLPDAGHNARLAAEERERLARARETMTEEALRDVAERAADLKRWQDTPDPPETLALVPSLALADLERAERRIPSEELAIGGARILCHELPTGGIVYLDVGLDLAALPAELVPYAAFFGRALLETGAGDADFVQVAQRLGRETGGVRAELYTSARHGDDAPVARLFLRGKATAARAGSLAAITRELLTAARLDNRERVRQIVLEEKAAREAALVPEGYRFTGARLAAGLHRAGWASDQAGGVGSLLFLRQLAARIDADWPGVHAELERVRGLLVRRGALVLNLTADAAGRRALEPHLAALAAAIPDGAGGAHPWPAPAGPAAEGLLIPAQVNYVAKGADLYRLGYRPHGSALVANTIVSNGWLWEQIRLQGGAYGGWSAFDWRAGVFACHSYRDPHLLRTLDVYDRAGAELRGASLSEADVTRAIVGTIGELDAAMLPDAQGLAALTRALARETHEMRQRLRDEVLGTTAAHLRAFADALDLLRDHGRVVALGGQAALDAAQVERPGRLEVTRVM